MPGFGIFAQEMFAPLALPSSRSSLVIFNQFLTLPPYSARLPLAGEWFLSPDIELSNVLLNAWVDSSASSYVDSLFDYETLSLELPVRWGLGEGWALGLDLQAGYLSGGFMDVFINTWHGWFGFPNNFREALPPNRVRVSLETNSGIDYHFDTARWFLADPLVSLVWGPVQERRFKLALQLTGSLPLGLGNELAGRPWPQIATGLNTDWWLFDWLGLHAQAGFILPIEVFWTPNMHPMGQLRLSIIINPGWDIMPFLDFNLHTSPVETDLFEGSTDYFGLPNTDLRFGIIICAGPGRGLGEYGALTIQEDPFTHNSSDVSLQAGGAFSLR